MQRSTLCVLSLLLPFGCGDDVSGTASGSTGAADTSGDDTSSTTAAQGSSSATSAADSSSSSTGSTGDGSTSTSGDTSGESSGSESSGGPADCVPVDLDWQETTPLPEAIGQRGRAVILGDRLYVAGGVSFTMFEGIASVYASTIADDGSLGDWEAQASLPGAGYSQQLVLADEQLWVLGNPDGFSPVFGGVPNAFAWRAEMDRGAIIGWTAMAPSLPSGELESFAAFGYGGRLYVAGGAPRFAGPIENNVYSAPVLGDRGLGAWSQHVNELPSPMIWGSAIATDNGAMLLGGDDPTQGAVGSVDFAATIFMSGAPGVWSSPAPLPERRLGPALAQAGTRTLAIGGAIPDASEQPAAPAAEVYSTQDGAAWATETPLPAARAFASAAANERFVFVVGGTTTPPTADPSVLVSAHCSFE